MKKKQVSSKLQKARTINFAIFTLKGIEERLTTLIKKLKDLDIKLPDSIYIIDNIRYDCRDGVNAIKKERKVIKDENN